MSTTTEKPPTFFLNIHTTDPDAAFTFFQALNFTPVPKYSDDQTKSLLLPAPNQNMCLMVHAHGRFKMFIRPDSDINDATKSTECLFSVSVDKKEAVDEWISNAVKAGGTADPYVFKDNGAACNMYTRSFADLDGHIWEVVTMFGDCEEKPEAADV